MKAWSAALTREVEGWPQASTRSFFGFTALYRKDEIFAILPKSRGMDAGNLLALRLTAPASDVSASLKNDPRIGIWSTQKQKARWFSFNLSSDADVHDVIEWLATAYEAAGKQKKKR